MTDTYFARRLRELRAAAGFGVVELARRAGLERTALHRLERGERSPTWDTVQSLAAALGVSTEEFRTGAKKNGENS